jgi:endonuclease YncB( thermonuclease family)
MLLAAAPLIPSLTPAAAADAVPCPPEAAEARAVTRIDAPAAMLLDDATELRLSGVLTPSARDVPAGASDWPPEAAARRAIEDLLADRRVRLATAAAFKDRYGRRVAHAVTDGGGDPAARRWLQAALIEGGHARVAPLPGETLCLAALFAREAVARATRSGLWSNPAYAIRSARDTRTLMALTGTFQIVEGWVAAIGGTRRELFLNFGRDWRWDFTAAVDLRRLPDRDATVSKLKALEGRYVRVRGWIEKRNGPFIELAAPDVIEELPEGLSSGP